MKSTFSALLASAFAVYSVAACADGHDDHASEAHMHLPQKRAYPSVPLTPPSRPLVWGDVNIIHTTDSHGWLLGHQKPSFPEPNYSGDFGDFASFVSHMKEIALEKGVDLLLVDSGDLHDGTGLTDGYPAGGVDAHDANKFFDKLPYDVLAIGNHELYDYPNTLDIYENFAPKYPGRYLSSNVNITVAGPNGTAVSVPVGSRFAKFHTLFGRKVTALGVLYDFTGNDHNTTVQKVEAMVNETWFKEAIAEEPDFFLLAGHMPVYKDKWPFVFNAIRAVHPTTPIFILGGHTHIRDCVQLDGRSMSLESGRYMETVGFLSANLDHKNSTANITFNRRYLDPNRVTYEYHTGRGNHSFDTWLGQEITRGLNELAESYDLSYLYGTAPQDYSLSRWVSTSPEARTGTDSPSSDPYPSNGSLLTLFIEQVIPVALAINNTRAAIPNIIITNSGELRFDLYKGPFTKNDQLTASPFTDSFLYIPNVTLGVASKVLPTLNKAGANEKRSLEREEELYGRGVVDMRYRAWLEEMDRRDGEVKRAAQNLTLGYVTQDSCPGVGDDTVHAPLPYYGSPDFLSSIPPTGADDTVIDLVFINFIQDQLLGVLNGLQSEKVYADSDVLSYSPFLADEVLGLFAAEKWN
ncbi:hypothetical protein BV25DRAFT_715601 [Artomyces pyxidatus]|uniref:Uncharacterized protein n=1 Tax=Artomyces pyxidatus TaxID=48021 RepID=A0ACB8T0A1_9AGAM|nr:hypothetical protein BV25DRAFT_715601 [Artomyces pyxidatus]